MRKNGSRLISLRQYRLTDLFLFAVILAVFDLLLHYAPILFPGGAAFTFTMTLPIVLLVMVRWNWYCVFYAVGDGILMTVLNNPSSWQSYLSYAIGNCAILILMIAAKFIGKKKIFGNWYFASLFTVAGWVLMNLGVSLMMTVCGSSPAQVFSANFGLGATGLMSLAVALLVILVLRKLDGMAEDQKQYLLRLDKERKERTRRDEYGDEPIEIDDETVSILKKWDDGLGN